MADEPVRLLDQSAFVTVPRDRLVCAAIVREDTAADLAPDILLEPLLPHDGEPLIDRTAPDLVLVESRAVTSGHPWAGAGEPSVVDPALRLRKIVDLARTRGIPSVLWWNDARSETPGLIPFEPRFDLVLSTDGASPAVDMAWSPGVQLSRFGCTAPGRTRTARPVWHGRWDRLPSRNERRALEAVARSVAPPGPDLWIDADITTPVVWTPPGLHADGVRRVGPAELGDAYRSRAVFLAEPVTGAALSGGLPVSVLRQLAAGARVVTDMDDHLQDAVGPWIDSAREARDVVSSPTADSANAPRDEADQRSLLRRLFRDLDTTASVAKVSTVLGLGRATPRRDVAVVAHLDDDVPPAALVDGVIGQHHRPVIALLVGPDGPSADRTIAELDVAGIAAKWIPARSLPDGSTGSAAAFTAAAWIWAWDPAVNYEATFVADAVIDALTSDVAADPYATASNTDRRTLRMPTGEASRAG